MNIRRRAVRRIKPATYGHGDLVSSRTRSGGNEYSCRPLVEMIGGDSMTPVAVDFGDDAGGYDLSVVGGLFSSSIETGVDRYIADFDH